MQAAAAGDMLRRLLLLGFRFQEILDIIDIRLGGGVLPGKHHGG
jgi:hypothetical protein